MNITLFSLYCGLMLSLSAFSIDILLPSLVAMGQGLNSSMEAVQLTIPVYMLALGLANPFYGVLGRSNRASQWRVYRSRDLCIRYSNLCCVPKHRTIVSWTVSTGVWCSLRPGVMSSDDP